MKPDWKIWEIFLNVPLVSAVCAMATAQLSKVFQPLFRGQAPRLRNLTDYGGMPSGHTSFITAVTVAIGLTEGWSSPVFALAGVVTSIMVYDIVKLRTAVEMNLEATGQLAERGEVKLSKKMPQMKGHTVPEAVAGIVWGIVNAVAVALLFSAIKK